MKKYLEQRIEQLSESYDEFNDNANNSEYDTKVRHINTIAASNTKARIEEIKRTLNYLNAQAESQNINNNESQRERLIDFVQWYNPKLGKNDASGVVEYFETMKEKSIKCD